MSALPPAHDLVRAAANRLGVDVRSLRAVLRVECGSDDPARWLGPAGRAILRVEARHVLRSLSAPTTWGLRVQRPEGGYYRGGPGCPAVHDGVVPVDEVEVDGAWSPYHGKQERTAAGDPGEYDALDVATSILGAEGAAACSSWGPGQVLGSNAAALGLDSALAVQRLAAKAEGGLELVERFLTRVKPWALEALRRKDWPGFAEAYNGHGQVGTYAAMLERELARIPREP